MPECPPDLVVAVPQGRQGAFHLFLDGALQRRRSLSSVRPLGQLVAQIDDDPFRRASAHPRGFPQPPQVSGADGRDQLIVLEGRGEGHGHLGADPADPEQQPEQVPLVLTLKSEQQAGVFPDDVVHVQCQGRAGGLGLQPVMPAPGHLHLVTDTGAEEQHPAPTAVLPSILQPTLQSPDHSASGALSMLTLLPIRRLLSVLVLALVLTGCSPLGQPPRSTLERALDLQVQLTREQLSEVLAIPAPTESPALSRVRLDSQRRERIEDQPVWHLRGRFDWRWGGEALRADTPFDLWLLPGERGQSWRLLRRDDPGRPGWRSWPLPVG